MMKLVCMAVQVFMSLHLRIQVRIPKAVVPDELLHGF